MREQVISHIRRSTRLPNDNLNILTGTAHERYESFLAKTGHNFYGYRHPSFKNDCGSWNENYAPIPPNYFLLNKDLGEHQLPIDIHPDCIFSHHKYSQFQLLREVGMKFGIPHIHLEHTWPVNFPQRQIDEWRKMEAHINVFISEKSREAWGWKPDEAYVIYHGVDTHQFKPNPKATKDMKPLSVVNDWINRDAPCGFNFWREATKDMEVKVVGDTPGLSRSANSTRELVEWYNRSYIFVNTSLLSPFPYSLYEAMSCGCCCISTATCAIPDVIEHGVNGLLAGNPSQMRQLILDAQNDKDMCKEIGRNARKTITEKFGLDKFVNNWHKIFNGVK